MKFTYLEDRDVVLYSGPYTIRSKPIIIKAWSPNFNFDTKVLQTIPIWVQLPNLPLNCWSMDSLSRIESDMGISIYVDECTTKIKRISYARFLVEMNITKPLPHSIKVMDPTWKIFEQHIEYDWVP